MSPHPLREPTKAAQQSALLVCNLKLEALLQNILNQNYTFRLPKESQILICFIFNLREGEERPPPGVYYWEVPRQRCLDHWKATSSLLYTFFWIVLLGYR